MEQHARSACRRVFTRGSMAIGVSLVSACSGAANPPGAPEPMLTSSARSQPADSAHLARSAPSTAAGTGTSPTQAADQRATVGQAGTSARAAPTLPTAAATAGAPAAVGGEWPADCENRYVFAAHGQAGASDRSKYPVQPGTEYHTSFLFRAPWGERKVQLLRSVGTIDNAKVVHHWNLYAVDDASVQDGEIRGGPGELTPIIPGEAMIVSGVPGSQPVLEPPPDVGIRMPTGKDLVLRFELHYNNPSDALQPDATQVELCVTSHPRAHEGAVHWLGTFDIELPPHARKDLTSHCVPNAMTQPVHVIALLPHMHRLGTHAKLTLARPTGEQVAVHDAAYSFNEQRVYYQPGFGAPGEVVVRPGDSLTTTCSFDNTTDRAVSYGENTEDEMCIMGVLAWPLGQLVNGTPLSLLVPGALPDVNCLQ